MTVVFRCDATAEIGFGHLSRCLALAEALRLSEVRSVFAGLYDPPAQDQIEAAGFERNDLATSVNGGSEEALTPQGATFLIIDSYQADATYLAGLRGGGCPTVVIDDFCELRSYPCDVVLNFTWDAKALPYPGGPRKLLGPTYFPARRRLVERRPQSIERPRGGPVRNLLIAIGGSDPKRIAARTVRLLRERHSEICVRLIAANNDDAGDSLAAFAPGSAIVPRQPDLSEQLCWADACITGGGLIKYESAFMGVPAATVAQNAGQDSETQALTRDGLVFDLGLADDRSDEELASAMTTFLNDDDLRAGLAERVLGVFPADPSAHAARSILAAIGN